MELFSFGSSIQIRPLQSNAGMQGKSTVLEAMTLTEASSLGEAGLELRIDEPKLSSGGADCAWEHELDESAVCV